MFTIVVWGKDLLQLKDPGDGVSVYSTSAKNSKVKSYADMVCTEHHRHLPPGFFNSEGSFTGSLDLGCLYIYFQLIVLIILGERRQDHGMVTCAICSDILFIDGYTILYNSDSRFPGTDYVN